MRIDGVATHFQAHVAELWSETNGKKILMKGGAGAGAVVEASQQEADETGKVSVYTNPINDCRRLRQATCSMAQWYELAQKGQAKSVLV